MNPVTVVAVGDTPGHAVDELERRSGGVSVVRRCPELAELLAACQSGLARVALVAGQADELTATLVDRLTAVGVAVVAVAATPAEIARLRGIGAFPVAGTATPDALAEAVLAAVNARKFPNPAGFAVPTESPGVHGVFDAGPLMPAVPEPDADPADHETATGQGASAGADGAEATHWWPRLRKRAASASDAAPEMPNGFEPVKGPAGVRPAGSEDTGEVAAEEPGEECTGVQVRPGSGLATGQHADTDVPGLAARPRPRVRSWRPGIHRRPHPARPGAAAAPEDGAPQLTMAVWGPVGSPGRTTVAVNLAAELATAGRTVMLIDADSYGASIAATLGLLDESASFAQACRVADQGLLTAAELARISTEVVFAGGTFSLLTGLTRSDRWPELRAAAVERVVNAARELADVVVIDCGFSLESDEELSYDTIAPRRNAATLSALGLADVVYAVGGSDTIGIPRLIRALAELPESCAGADLRIVLNKVRRKAVGGTPEKALEQAWERFGPSQAIGHYLPWDGDLTDRALLEGRLLQEIAPDSLLRRAIVELCCAPVQRNQNSAVTNATARA
ncbi:MAG: P-loop NTPase [Specibacter sp.]